VDGIGLEQILQAEPALVRRQVPGRFRGRLQKRIARCSRNVVFKLGDERWNDVEGLVNPGKLIQDLDHPIVVLQGVQADPRQPVLGGNQILVEGLMLMPKNDYA
jgi:hypothetical protein